MYFAFFKLHSWDKRSADNRRRLIQQLLKQEEAEPGNLVTYASFWE